MSKIISISIPEDLYKKLQKVKDRLNVSQLCKNAINEALKMAENDDIVYCGLTFFLITLNSDVIIALRKMQAQDETLRELLELAMRKLHNEDISEEIAVLEREEEREEMKILLERLKRF